VPEASAARIGDNRGAADVGSGSGRLGESNCASVDPGGVLATDRDQVNGGLYGAGPTACTATPPLMTIMGELIGFNMLTIVAGQGLLRILG